MSHWLEEAERNQRKSRHRSISMGKRIAQKKTAIRANYEKNKEQYDGFVKVMYNLVKRVNELPEEYREPFRKITGVSKKTKLENQLHFFSSSRREKKYDFFSFSWLKPTHAKHIRVFYLYISKEDGFVNFEIKENYLLRKRLSESGKEKKEDTKKSSQSKDRVHVVFRFPMEKLNEKAGLQIIDWLVFKKQIQELPIWTDVPIEEKQFF
jgi:hypothetical protein